MNTSALEKLLQQSLQDFKLDQDEKHRFRELSKVLEDEQLRFIRNKAFDLSRPHVKLGGVDALRVLNWLERVIKSIQPVNENTQISSEAFFSPGVDCRNKIISLINGAKKSINICVFTISDNKITEAILKAHQRDVVVTIISDNDKSNDRGSDIQRLSEKGVQVLLDKTSYHMHHKFAIFDHKVLLSGSFNWTRSATTVNEENILVTGDVMLLERFEKQFENLRKQFS